jgi:hypothetical protein
MVLMTWHILYSGHTITNDQKVSIVTLGDLYYPYTTIKVCMTSYVARYNRELQISCLALKVLKQSGPLVFHLVASAFTQYVTSSNIKVAFTVIV